MNRFNIKKSALLVVAAITMQGCGSDEEQLAPKDPLNLASYDTELFTNIDTALNTDVFVGQTLSQNAPELNIDLGPVAAIFEAESEEAALEKASQSRLVTSTFSLTGNTILVPDPNKCPSDDDYLVELDTTWNTTNILVNGVPNASAYMGDQLALQISPLKNVYGAQYEATLDYGGITYPTVVLTTAEAQDISPEPLIFRAVYDDTDAVVNLSDGKSFEFENVKDNQLVKFELNFAQPVENADSPQTFERKVYGVDPGIKSSLTLVTDDGQTFTYSESDDKFIFTETLDTRTDFENGETYPYMWVNIKNGNQVLPYNSCAKLDDSIELNVVIPDKTFSKTFSGTLTWVTGYEENGSEITETHRFSITTAPEDTVVDTIEIGELFDLPIGEDRIIDIPVTGTNARLPVTISGDGVSYSIDGGEFTTEAGFIDEGQTLQLKFEATSEYYTEYNPILMIGAEVFTGFARIEANPAWPKVNTSLLFPAHVSATAADEVIIRGNASIFLPDGFDGVVPVLDATNLEIILNDGQSVNVDSYDANTGIWTYVAALSDGENRISIQTVLQAGSGLAEASPINIQVQKLSNKDELFPATAGNYGGFYDLTIDGRDSLPRIYLSDGLTNKKHVYYYDLALNASGQAAPVRFTKDVSQNMRGIQINPYEVLAEGEPRSIFRSGTFAGIGHAYLNGQDTDLSNSSEFGVFRIHGGGNVGNNLSHMAVPESGDMIVYTTRDWNKGGKVGLFQVPLKTLTADQIPTDGTMPIVSKFSSSGDFVPITTQFAAAQSVEVLSVMEGDVKKEYFLTLSRTLNQNAGNGNATGDNKLWIIEKSATYDIATSASEIVITDEAAATVVLKDATSIAIDDENMKAYIVNGKTTLLELDLTNAISANTATSKEMTLLSDENEFTQLSSMVMEGGLPYLVATDSKQNAVFAIDPVTGERVYLLQGGQ